jgi:hypothetical protein
LSFLLFQKEKVSREVLSDTVSMEEEELTVRNTQSENQEVSEEEDAPEDVLQKV